MDMFLERNEDEATEVDSPYNDEELLELWTPWKKECFENRWIFERGWMRNIHYIANRHWIEYVRRSNEWRDVKLAKWFPKPVTNKIGEGVVALRSMFASVNIGANVRPNGNDPENVAVAAVADEYQPLLHEEHVMDSVMDEHDFWFIATGNAFIHSYMEYDGRHGFNETQIEQCTTCNSVLHPEQIVEAGQKCPQCGNNGFLPASDPTTGEPMIERKAKGKGVTAALSPFEIAFPNSYARFDDVPYVVRLRWRSKDYYENHPELKSQVTDIKWSKAPSETSLQLFRSLPYHNDMGVAPFLGASNGTSEEEGAAEYEVWVRPCDKYPKGLVFRVLGDSNPIILHLEKSEAIPGEIPYRDVEDTPVFPFAHSPFEQRGGRVWGTSPLDGAIQKQNQLNQLDSFILMIINRMGNPLWLVPKGAEIERFTGEPGLVVKWNPLTVGGNAKPERVDGLGPSPALFQIREQYLRDIEESMGTFDILKGSKPGGVDSFAGMQLLVERGQSRFTSAFKSRGKTYREWLKFALEIERAFGPEERLRAIKSPAGSWRQKAFKNADLQGSFSIIVEDGSTTPKTALGIRATVEHLNQLGFLDRNDPDQKHKVFELFGQSDLSPALDIHMQAALRKQEAFEEWANNPAAMQQSITLFQQKVQEYQQQIAMIPPTEPQIDPATGMDVAPQPQLPPPPSITATTPLAWKPWYNAPIHKQEFLKWANGDRVVELLQKNPQLEQVLAAHLQEIDGALIQMAAQMAPPQPQKPGGAAMAMTNSNREAGGLGVEPGQPGAAKMGA